MQVFFEKISQTFWTLSVKECFVVATRAKDHKQQSLQTHCTGCSRVFDQGVLFLYR